MKGCPKCGQKDHWFDQCVQPQEWPNERHWYNIVVRNGLPPFRQSEDFRMMPGFQTNGARPMTPAFAAAKKREGCFDQFVGQPIIKGATYDPDPAWREEMELKRRFPLGSIVHPDVARMLQAERDNQAETAEVRRKAESRHRLQPRIDTGLEDHVLSGGKSKSVSKVKNSVKSQRGRDMVEVSTRRFSTFGLGYLFKLDK
jgi:hypothetical protein